VIESAVSRRSFLVSSALVATPLWVDAQQLIPVRLLVLRRIGLSPTNQCVAPCTRGSIYDVSDLNENPSDALLPVLKTRKPICDVIERAWKDNKPNTSSIPKGVYTASVRTDKTKPWMTNENRWWRIELAGTNLQRSAIQFHYGQDVSWSTGCFIVGTVLQKGDDAGVTKRYCSVENGEAAVAALRAAVSAPGRDASKISIGVFDDAGMFAGLQPKEPC
jgi:Family of unknown function (DUF5675)